MEKGIQETLEQAGIKPTAVRMLVFREISATDGVFCLADMESRLETVDKSSIFRSLCLFLEHGLLHEIDDGSGTRKYCRCSCTDRDRHDSHIHFSCTSCHKTFCIKDISLPSPPVPGNFVIKEVNCVIKGLCPECAHKHDRP